MLLAFLAPLSPPNSTPWVVRPDGGRRVELLKIERIRASRSESWEPDGTLTKSRLPGEGTDIFARMNWTKQRLGIFVHIDADRNGDQGYQAVASYSPGIFGYGILYASSPDVILHPVFKLPPPGLDSATFRIGVATGAWATSTRSAPYKLSASSNPSQAAIEVPLPSDGLTFQYRAVAFDRRGKSFSQLREAGSMKRAGRTTSFYQLNGLKTKDIARLELQRRRYRWATFRNVPLTPG